MIVFWGSKIDESSKLLHEIWRQIKGALCSSSSGVFLGDAACLGPCPSLAEEVFITCSCLGSGIEFRHLCPCSLSSLHDILYHLNFPLLTLSTRDLLPFFPSSFPSPPSLQVNVPPHVLSKGSIFVIIFYHHHL